SGDSTCYVPGGPGRTISCTTGGPGLTWPVGGTITLTAHGYATSGASVTNPADGGVCLVDNGGLLTERNAAGTGETNNGCSSTVAVAALTLTALCHDEAELPRFRVRNPLPYDVEYTWHQTSTGASGTRTAPANNVDDIFTTPGVAGDPNTLV